MPINFTDFSKAPLQDTFATNLVENLTKGYKMGREPARMAEEQKKAELANALQKKALEHKDKEYALADALKQASIKKANRAPSTTAVKNALKFNGPVANAEGIWRLQHPEGVPLTPAEQKEHLDFLKNAFNTALEHTAKGTERTQILNETQNDRAPRSPVTKDHYEIQQIDKGNVPYSQGKDKLTPTQQTNMRNDLLLDVVKKTTDPAVRMKLLNAKNMNITLGSINPEKLTKYSGIEGYTDKFFDQVLEGADVGPKEYQDYVHEVIKASAAAKQMRQYLGDSIQPIAQERLDHLTNPSAWNVSPKVAKENFEFIRDLYKQETQTLVSAANDPSVYRPEGYGNNPAPQAQPSGGFNFSQFPVAGGR